jgi:hypothetical protein
MSQPSRRDAAPVAEGSIAAVFFGLQAPPQQI